MKKLLSIVLLIGFLSLSALATASPSESPPVSEQVFSLEEGTELLSLVDVAPAISLHCQAITLEVNTLTLVELEVVSYRNMTSASYVSLASITADMFTRVIEPKPTTLERGRDVYVRNIGYTLYGKEMNKASTKKSVDTYLKLDGTDLTRMLHTSGLSDCSKLI
jgi:hypothetical protein